MMMMSPGCNSTLALMSPSFTRSAKMHTYACLFSVYFSHNGCTVSRGICCKPAYIYHRIERRHVRDIGQGLWLNGLADYPHLLT